MNSEEKGQDVLVVGFNLNKKVPDGGAMLNLWFVGWESCWVDNLVEII